MVTDFTTYLMFADTLPVFRGGYYSLVVNRLTEQSGGLRKEGRSFFMRQNVLFLLTLKILQTWK